MASKGSQSFGQKTTGRRGKHRCIDQDALVYQPMYAQGKLGASVVLTVANPRLLGCASPALDLWVAWLLFVLLLCCTGCAVCRELSLLLARFSCPVWVCHCHHSLASWCICVMCWEHMNPICDPDSSHTCRQPSIPCISRLQQQRL